MRTAQTSRSAGLVCVLTAFLLLGGMASAHAQEQPPAGQPAVSVQGTPDPTRPTFEIYGFAMLDFGHDFKQIHPDWYDTLRLTRLPQVANEFGEDHSTFAGVRQSRLGVRSSAPTSLGEFKTIFEFELFGTGVDSGQTTFRLRHAWGELGRIGAGQYLEPFYRP